MYYYEYSILLSFVTNIKMYHSYTYIEGPIYIAHFLEPSVLQNMSHYKEKLLYLPKSISRIISGWK